MEGSNLYAFLPIFQLPIRSVPCSTWFSSRQASPSSSPPSRIPTPATHCEENAVTLDYTLAAIVTLAVLAYLVFALIRPERF